MRYAAAPPAPGRPLWTAFLCIGAAIAWYVPALAPALVFDRSAIEAGQVWRIATGSLVHFSAAHFAADVAALALLGGLAEWRRVPGLGLALGLGALAVGVAVLLGAPQLRWYGGLSGLVTAVLVLLLLDGLRGRPGARLVACAGLLLVGAKLGLEMATGASWLVASSGQPFVAAPISHVAGAGTALVVWFVSRNLGRAGPTFASGSALLPDPSPR